LDGFRLLLLPYLRGESGFLIIDSFLVVSLPPHSVSLTTASFLRLHVNPCGIKVLLNGCHPAFMYFDWRRPAQEANMAQFTQLGLSGKPEKKPEGNTAPKPTTQPNVTQPKKTGDKKKTAVLAGLLIAASLIGVFFLESGCTKSSNPAATIAAPVQTAVNQPSSAGLIPPISAPLPNQTTAKKKSRQRKLSASSYSNPTYGVSFRYPKRDSLKEGDDANLEWDGLGPVEMNFVQPGGTTVSAVELPRKLYSGTDFNSAFFNVSVNSKLTADQCAQFAFPVASDADPITPSKTKVGATEFNVMEGFAGEDTKQADVKYYHVFENGSCYEFALGLETALPGDANSDDAASLVKPVDHNEVFRSLNWILSTVKIQAVDLPRKNIPEVASETPSVPVDSTITQVH
jgi:hypothetical protein